MQTNLYERQRGILYNEKRFNSPKKVAILNVYTLNNRAANILSKIDRTEREIEKSKC